MLRHMFIIPLLVLSFNGLAGTVRALNYRALAASHESRSSLPNFNIESGCQDVAHNDLNKTTNYRGCLSEEKKARGQLQKEWASYSTGMHSQCMHLVTPPALPSYVTLRQCLIMSRDAQKMTKNNGASRDRKNDAGPFARLGKQSIPDMPIDCPAVNPETAKPHPGS